MCQALVGRIIALSDTFATVSTKKADVHISVELLDGVQMGDYVLFSGGVGIERLSVEKARKIGGEVCK